MAISLLGPFNKIINDTTTQIVDSKLPNKISDVLTTFITSSFQLVDNTLKEIQDITKAQPAAATSQPAAATPPASSPPADAPANPPASGTPPATGTNP
jgi:hypothetical protein